MFASIAPSLALVVAPPPLATGATIIATPSASAMLPPQAAAGDLFAPPTYELAQSLAQRLSFETTMVLTDAGARSEWAVALFGNADLEAIAATAIPIAIGVVLLLFFRLLKMFASAF